MKKIKKSYLKIGDKVKVIAGLQKGFLGNISSILTKKSTLIIEGINPRVTYRKNPQSESNTPNKKVEIPVTIHISNVMIWDKEQNRVGRIGFKMINCEKKRYFKKSNQIIE